MARGGLISHRYGVVYLGRGVCGVGWGKGGYVSFQPSRSLQHLSDLFGPLILHS